MKKGRNDRMIYSINVGDIQEVADQVLERRLTKKEIVLVEESVGDYIDWFQAIENAIREHVIWSMQNQERIGEAIYYTPLKSDQHIRCKLWYNSMGIWIEKGRTNYDTTSTLWQGFQGKSCN